MSTKYIYYFYCRIYIIYYTMYSTLYIEVLLRVAKGVEEKLKVCGHDFLSCLGKLPVGVLVYSDCQMTPKWRGVGQRQHSFPPIFATMLYSYLLYVYCTAYLTFNFSAQFFLFFKFSCSLASYFSEELNIEAKIKKSLVFDY